jgi:predicted  nucleic acid-binding Zn-ribbon protein
MFRPAMKSLVTISILVCFAMISACQKQDSTAEAQIAQRKAELDTREKALDEREKALTEKEKMIARFRAIPSDLEARKPAIDPEQAKAEREKRIQQLPPELQALIRDRALLDPQKAKGMTTQDPAGELQRRLEEARSKRMGAMASPNAETANPEATSPAPSPTPE